MDKNNPMFNDMQMGWNYMNNPMQNMQQPIPEMDMMGNQMFNPSYQYEQMYMYYKYLTQLMEYKIKQKELEKLEKEMK